MLTENVAKSLRLGIIGHIKQMEDMPDGTFFIGDSLRKAIFGPFEVTEAQKYYPEAVEFYREPPELVSTQCHYLTKFEPCSEAGQGDIGILWEVLAEQVGVPKDAWFNLRRTPLDAEQISTMYAQLVLANSGEDICGAVSLETLTADKETWKAFVETSTECDWHEQDVYESSYEGMVEILFLGDEETARRNMKDGEY